MPMVDYSPVLKMMEKAIRATDALGRASYTPSIPDDEYEEDLGEEFNAAGRAR